MLRIRKIRKAANLRRQSLRMKKTNKSRKTPWKEYSEVSRTASNQYGVRLAVSLPDRASTALQQRMPAVGRKSTQILSSEQRKLLVLKAKKEEDTMWWQKNSNLVG